MTLTRNQKIGIGVGALLLLLLGKKQGWFKKKSISSTVEENKVASTTSTTSYSAPYAADGSEITFQDKVIEAYKSLIGMIAYVRIGKDNQSSDIRDAIAEQVIATGKSQDRLLLEFAVKMNKGKEGLKDAVKMIDKDVSGHVQYFIDNGKFLIEAK